MMPKRLNFLYPAALCVSVVLAGVQNSACIQKKHDAKKIASGGIDDRLNSYPWSMELFDGNGDGTPEIYVGTVGNYLCSQTPGMVKVQEVVQQLIPELQLLPPERWQCRNDLWGQWFEFYMASSAPAYVYRGTYDSANDVWEWERVWAPDYSEVTGLRGAIVYNGALYMLGGERTLSAGYVWKTTDGETFEKASPSNGPTGYRAAQVFKGKLYVGSDMWGEIYVSEDPQPTSGSWQQANSTGFVDEGGSANNGPCWQFAVFDDHLYAVTMNSVDGAELWKSNDPYPGNWTRVISGGYGNPKVKAYYSLIPFGDYLYVGSAVYPTTFHEFSDVQGCEILRVDADDNVELLVGMTRNQGEPNEIAPLSGMGPGFGRLPNLYAWTMDVYDGWLYVGTCDFGGLVMDIVDEVAPGGVSPANQWLLELFLGQAGFDLWRTKDGIQWEAVFQDGLGEADNYGIRNMKSTPWGHVLGVANPIDGFEIWIEGEEDPQTATSMDTKKN